MAHWPQEPAREVAPQGQMQEGWQAWQQQEGWQEQEQTRVQVAVASRARTAGACTAAEQWGRRRAAALSGE